MGGMVRIELAVDIAAAPARVWRALCQPAEVVRWESGVVEVLDAPADYPRPGQVVHWRTPDGAVLEDRPQVVEHERALRSLLRLGRARFDETYTLEAIDGGSRLAVMVEATSTLPGAAATIERLHLGPATRRDFAAALASIKHYCES
jgi:uncharacterized protein YndB with AHSA1/START domain